MLESRKFIDSSVCVVLFWLLAPALAPAEASPVIEREAWSFDRSDLWFADGAPQEEEQRRQGVIKRFQREGWVEYDVEIPESGWYALWIAGQPVNWGFGVEVDGEAIWPAIGMTQMDFENPEARPRQRGMFKKGSRRLEAGRHRIRLSHEMGSHLPSRWELRPAGENAFDALCGRLEVHRSQPPGSEWRLTVAGGPAAAGDWELVAQNAKSGEQKAVGSFSIPSGGGESLVVFKLPGEGAWHLVPGRGGQIGRPADLIGGLVVESSVFAPEPEAAESLPSKLEFEGIFSSGGTLQHGKPLPVWGYAPPGREVVVTLAGQKRSVTADDHGGWRVTFGALAANSGPHELVAVAGEETAKVADLLVGEVWLFSGQSNMGGDLHQSAGAEEFIASVNLPEVRMAKVMGEDSDSSARLVRPAGWGRLAPDAKGNRAGLQRWIAIPAGFGAELHAALGMPVGILINNRGGTAIHTWTSLKTQRKMPAFAPELRAFLDMTEKRGDLAAAASAVNEALTNWREKVAQAEARGEEVPSIDLQQTMVNAMAAALRGVGSNYAGPCAVNYDALLAPIAPYAIRGVAWYQGESDSGSATRYREKLPAMIDDWRTLWKDDTLPFLIVQLAPGRGDLPKGHPNPRTTTIKEVQAQVAAQVSNCALVVSNDLPVPGDDVHYLNKFPVGVRLAAAALAKVYGKDVPASGPVYREMKIEGNRLRLFFDELHGGLKVDGDALRGFMVAGEDQVFHWADAELDGDTVLVGNAAVPEPVAARYAWDDGVSGNTLKNQAGLPAPSFRTDDWPCPSLDK